MKIYIDGKFHDKAEAKISVFDHGLLYGDGIFEGIRLYGGRVFRLEEHIARLYDSARAICMEIPISRDEMTQAILETCRANELQDGYVRLLVTRGEGSLGLSPESCPRPCIIIIAATIALYPEECYQKGLDMVTCGTRRTTPGGLNPAVKSLNYLNNVMGKIEAAHANAGEGVMLNEHGYVAECTGDNIFIIKNGKMATPPLSSGALGGITREVVFELAKDLETSLEERNLTRYDIYVADECFLTGTAAEVIPAVTLDGRKIGTGQPGPLTEQFINAFRALTRKSGTPIYE